MLLRPLGAMKGCCGTAGAGTLRGVAGAPTEVGTGAARGSFGMGVACAGAASASTTASTDGVRMMRRYPADELVFIQSLESVISGEGIEYARAPSPRAPRLTPPRASRWAPRPWIITLPLDGIDPRFGQLLAAVCNHAQGDLDAQPCSEWFPARLSARARVRVGVPRPSAARQLRSTGDRAGRVPDRDARPERRRARRKPGLPGRERQVLHLQPRGLPQPAGLYAGDVQEEHPGDRALQPGEAQDQAVGVALRRVRRHQGSDQGEGEEDGN